MSKLKPISVASLMMLVWLFFYVIAAFFATKWAAFLAIIGCTAPMLTFGKNIRGETFGARDCNTLKYKKKEYVFFFLLCISGCALISAITYFVASVGYVETEVAARSDFPYLLVFGCFIPAFFEEWFVRGGVLGALAPYKAGAVWICAIFFMLMHADPTKYIYALFAGFLITALVYLTECIYLGMLLHFLNNFASLLLSRLPQGIYEYIALLVIAVVFILSLLVLRKTKIFADLKGILSVGKDDSFKGVFTLTFCTFVFASICVMIFRFL